MFADTYKTIAAPSCGCYSEKGSKFIAHAFPVSEENSVKMILADLKKQYHDARHHCYAYILGYTKSATRLNDDGEPSGTAARPIYGQLLSRDLTNILVVVSRYFGGTKLGIPGLIHAYKTATEDALDKSMMIEKYIMERYRVTFNYAEMNRVMQILKNENVKIEQQQADNQCSIIFSVRMKSADSIISLLKKIKNCKIDNP
ncbi:MAG: YigZ family protein [Bacteroidales bacterium]|jgi:uncharacterized YigZ family protein|nr:YigZ family protein [Bacteroidales bacterium]